MTSLVMRTSILIRPLPRNYLHQVQARTKISHLAWLMKMLEKSSNNPDSSPEDVKINSVLIEKIPDPVPLSGKGKRTPKLDFPLGL